MFTVYVFLLCNKKLEKVPKLKISERSVTRLRIGKSRLLELVRFKDFGFRTAEKLERNETLLCPQQFCLPYKAFCVILPSIICFYPLTSTFD